MRVWSVGVWLQVCAISACLVRMPKRKNTEATAACQKKPRTVALTDAAAAATVERPARRSRAKPAEDNANTVLLCMMPASRSDVTKFFGENHGICEKEMP